MIGIDGEEPFSERWAGSDVSRLVDDDQPFLPRVVARRVAIGYCPCGGGDSDSALAPLICLSPDEQTISWVDFRSFNLSSWGSVPRKLAAGEGFPYEAPDLHFDAQQYRDEVERLKQERTWESPPRLLARLVQERLLAMDLQLSPGIGFSRASWHSSGVYLVFECTRSRCKQSHHRQQLLYLDTLHDNPAAAAADIIARLLATPTDQWVQTFPWR